MQFRVNSTAVQAALVAQSYCVDLQIQTYNGIHDVMMPHYSVKCLCPPGSRVELSVSLSSHCLLVWRLCSTAFLVVLLFHIVSISFKVQVVWKCELSVFDGGGSASSCCDSVDASSMLLLEMLQMFVSVVWCPGEDRGWCSVHVWCAHADRHCCHCCHCCQWGSCVACPRVLLACVYLWSTQVPHSPPPVPLVPMVPSPPPKTLNGWIMMTREVPDVVMSIWAQVSCFYGSKWAFSLLVLLVLPVLLQIMIHDDDDGSFVFLQDLRKQFPC